MPIKKIKLNNQPKISNLNLFDNLENLKNDNINVKNIVELEIDKIIQNPNQPRKNFNKEKLEELVKSIEKNGILQPIVVRPKSDKYEIIFGERRYRAALQLGYTKIPAIIRDNIDDNQTLLTALIENIQRDDLTPIELAETYQKLLDQLNITHEELAELLGKTRVSITNCLRLNKLPDQIKLLVNQGKLTEGHARALLSIKSPELQLEVCNKIIKDELSVRETEKLIHKIALNVSRETSHKLIKDEHILEIENELSKILGMKVNIKLKNKSSKIEIICNTQSELENIINKLLTK